MSKQSFYQSVIVLDTETTDLDPETAEIVEIGTASGAGNSEWILDSMLLGARNGIPPEASAVNNISNKMIAGLPYFDQQITPIWKKLYRNDGVYYVAHNAGFDMRALSASFKRAGAIGPSVACISKSQWLCTWRLSRAILAPDFDALSNFQLNYLRYFFDLDVEATDTHRASTDCLICAKLLEMIVEYGIAVGRVNEDEPLGPQLNDICWGHIPVTKFPIGKHKGTLLKDVPTDYYMWALKNMDMLKEDDPNCDTDLLESVRQELESRLAD